MILILMVEGARAVISFCIRSAIPGYMVVPPDMTVLAYRSFLMSTSHFMMELKVVSWMPQASIPRKEGWKRASGQRKRSFPMVWEWLSLCENVMIALVPFEIEPVGLIGVGQYEGG